MCPPKAWHGVCVGVRIWGVPLLLRAGCAPRSPPSGAGCPAGGALPAKCPTSPALRWAAVSPGQFLSVFSPPLSPEPFPAAAVCT